MEKLWTTSEVTQYLGISEGEVERLVQAGRLTAYKLAGQFLRFKPEQVKTLKRPGSSRPQPASAAALAPEPRSAAHASGQAGWPERLRDFLYFYDFYLLSFVLLAALIIYLISSSSS